MSDEAQEEKPRKRGGLGTDQWEKVERLRSDAISDERKDNEKVVDRLEDAWKGRAEAAERAATMYFRLTIGMLAIVSMLVAGTVAVGAGIEIPGVGSFSVNKDAKPERASPGAESFNEQAEEPFAAPPGVKE